MDSNKAISIIRKQTLAGAVAESLRDRILTAELNGGTKLVQKKIADQYQVSQITVREAFLSLQSEGLVDIVKRHGATVRTVSPEELKITLQLRLLLEPELLAYSLPHITSAELDEASKCLDDLELAYFRKQQFACYKLNLDFHLILYSQCRAEFALDFIRKLNIRCYRYIKLQMNTHNDSNDIANNEHRELLDYCRTKQIHKACELLRHHILNTLNRLEQYIEL